MLNLELIPHIYAWRKADPDGVAHTKAPQFGAWHSPTDMHTRRELYPLLWEVFEFMHGVYEDIGYDRAFELVCDSMWVNINPRGAYNRSPATPQRIVERSLLRTDP